MNKQEAIQIMNKVHSALANTNEPGAQHVAVESLMSIDGWINTERANEIFEDVVALISNLPENFLDRGEGAGWTFLNIPTLRDANGNIGEVWGSQMHAGALVLIAAYYGIVQDPHHTLGFAPTVLNDMPGGVAYFSFNVQPAFLDAVRRSLGITKTTVITRETSVIV